MTGEPNQSSGEDRGRVGAGRPRRNLLTLQRGHRRGQVEVAVLQHDPSAQDVELIYFSTAWPRSRDEGTRPDSGPAGLRRQSPTERQTQSEPRERPHERPAVSELPGGVGGGGGSVEAVEAVPAVAVATPGPGRGSRGTAGAISAKNRHILYGILACTGRMCAVWNPRAGSAGGSRARS